MIGWRNTVEYGSLKLAFIQGVSQVTLQTQNVISPELMRVFPRKFHCITGRSYLTTYDFVGLRSSINLIMRHRVVLIICDHGFQTFPLLAETSSVIYEYELHN